MAFEEKTIESEIVYSGPVFKIRKHKVNAVGGRVTYRDIIEHNGGSVMVALTESGKVLMVRQFRKSMERVMLELPAGKIDPGEDAGAAAVRELKEETGYTAGRVEHLITINPSCGYTTELLRIYLCTDLTPGETSFDETEDLDLVEVDADELYGMVMAGELVDAKTVIGVLYARAAGRI